MTPAASKPGRSTTLNSQCRTPPELGRRGGCNPRRSRSLEETTPGELSKLERGHPAGTGEEVVVDVSASMAACQPQATKPGGRGMSTLGTTIRRRAKAPARTPTCTRKGSVTAGTAGEEGLSQSGLRPGYDQASPRVRQGHARAPHTLAHDKGKGHAAQTKRKLTSFDPRSFRTPRVQDNALVASHAPSGGLVDRAAGLRAQTWSTDVAPRTSPAVSVYNGGVE